MNEMTIDEMNIGDMASTKKTISESDVYLFAGITGDLNPAHTDEISASNGIFHGRVAHGILVTGLISAVLGMKLPGPGTIYLGQEVKFTKPVYFGDTITATCTVSSIRPEKNIVNFETICTNQKGETVISGIATVMPPKKSV
ncbi:MAG: MaoC family dehydratase [Oscillospiraceae bacterium]|nr:MaoC family dehydratase [Oscillospiraceae bacterium]